MKRDGDFWMSSGIANDLLAMDDNAAGTLPADIRRAFEQTAVWRGNRVIVVLTEDQRVRLAQTLDEESDHPYFYGAERRVDALCDRLRGRAKPKTSKPRNSFAGVSREQLLATHRRKWSLVYRGRMPADLVAMLETAVWEMNLPYALPRLTWRVGDPNGRLRYTHDGGASGRYYVQSKHIVVTAGPDPVGTKSTVLHELAHALAPHDPKRHHDPAFYRILIALYRRFRVPMRWLDYGNPSRAALAGRRLLMDDPVAFPNRGKPRPTENAPTPPVASESTLRRSQRQAARRPKRTKRQERP